jgi:hypothetical protein
MQVSIRESGMAAMRTHLAGVVAAGKAVSGPIISLTNKEAYAGPIERGKFLSGPRAGRVARKAGGAFMYREGIRAMQPKIGPALLAAIPKGAAGVMSAKKKLNDDAVVEVQARTPVRSGKLRAGVQPSTRSG